MSKINVIVSGCGISYHDYNRWPTWTKLIKVTGVAVTSMAAPAVSNIYIVNSLLKQVIQTDATHVICQLSSCGKLDVLIETEEQKQELVDGDSTRNFMVNANGKVINDLPGFWPSSHSLEHLAKELWNKHLHRDAHEMYNLTISLNALAEICKFKNIKLQIVEGYQLNWDLVQTIDPTLTKRFTIEPPVINDWYLQFCSDHDLLYTDVPNLDFQFCLAEYFLHMIGGSSRLQKLEQIRQSLSTQSFSNNL